MTTVNVKSNITQATSNGILSAKEARNIVRSAKYSAAGRETKVTSGEYTAIKNLYRDVFVSGKSNITAKSTAYKVLERFLIDSGLEADFNPKYMPFMEPHSLPGTKAAWSTYNGYLSRFLPMVPDDTDSHLTRDMLFGKYAVQTGGKPISAQAVMVSDSGDNPAFTVYAVSFEGPIEGDISPKDADALLGYYAPLDIYFDVPNPLVDGSDIVAEFYHYNLEAE